MLSHKGYRLEDIALFKRVQISYSLLLITLVFGVIHEFCLMTPNPLIQNYLSQIYPTMLNLLFCPYMAFFLPRINTPNALQWASLYWTFSPFDLLNFSITKLMKGFIVYLGCQSAMANNDECMLYEASVWFTTWLSYWAIRYTGQKILPWNWRRGIYRQHKENKIWQLSKSCQIYRLLSTKNMSISWVIFKSQFVIVAIDKPKKNDY